jgi:signal transduction histidine kinase
MPPIRNDDKALRSLLGGVFALLALVIPSLVGYVIYEQMRRPVFDAMLDWQTGVILEVPQNSFANIAGFWVGDQILSVEGVPFAQWSRPEAENVQALVQRNGQVIQMELPLVPLARLNYPALISAALVALVYWAAGLLLFVRRFRQSEIRLIFVVTQAVGIALLFPMAYMPKWVLPHWGLNLSVVSLFWASALILHHTLTFPVKLVALRQRVSWMAVVYVLALLATSVWLLNPGLGRQVGIAYTAIVITAALGVMTYVYLRRAGQDDRRRQRLVFIGSLLSGLPAVLFFLLPTIANSPTRLPVWLVGLCTVFAPLSYLIAVLQHNLFGIDRLLNRSLVYAILSFGILLLYLGPFLAIFSFSRGDWLAQIMVGAGLTLLVGLMFGRSRLAVEKFVDSLFYGGWYDYPGVVESAADALAHCVASEQLIDVLTRQVPSQMQLRHSSVTLDPHSNPQQQPFPIRLNLPLVVQDQPVGSWLIGPHQDGDDLSESDQRILQTIARQAGVALSNVQLIETLRRQFDEIHASRQALSRAQHQLMRSREEERARLARDLHDGPLQTLVGMNVNLGLILSQSENLHGPPAIILDEMRAEVRSLLSELRGVCAELRPPLLDTLGLAAALQALAEDWADQQGASIQLDIPPAFDLRLLPTEVALNFYRIAQEALNNVARHANASQVIVSLTWQDGRLDLSIRDNGLGFTSPPDPDRLAVKGHFGLVGMRERAQIIGAQLSIDSSPPEMGACVRLSWRQPAGAALM